METEKEKWFRLAKIRQAIRDANVIIKSTKTTVKVQAYWLEYCYDEHNNFGSLEEYNEQLVNVCFGLVNDKCKTMIIKYVILSDQNKLVEYYTPTKHKR